VFKWTFEYVFHVLLYCYKAGAYVAIQYGPDLICIASWWLTAGLQGALKIKSRRALGRAHVPQTKVFPPLAVNKTILKPRLAAVTGGQYVYVGFSRCHKIPHCSTYKISEKAVWFWHLDYNSDRAQKLTSSRMSRHLSTCNISSKSMHAFLSNFANRDTWQTDRQTQAKTFTSSFVGGKNTRTWIDSGNECHLDGAACLRTWVLVRGM